MPSSEKSMEQSEQISSRSFIALDYSILTRPPLSTARAYNSSQEDDEQEKNLTKHITVQYICSWIAKFQNPIFAIITLIFRAGNLIFF